jgi:hypothetical protein
MAFSLTGDNAHYGTPTNPVREAVAVRQQASSRLPELLEQRAWLLLLTAPWAAPMRRGMTGRCWSSRKRFGSEFAGTSPRFDSRLKERPSGARSDIG